MSKSKFTKHLRELNIEEMRHELLNLYAKVPEVRKYYATELGSEKDMYKYRVVAIVERQAPRIHWSRK